MGLKESGVRLVAQDYEAYIQKLNNINKAHEETFSDKPGKKAKAGAEEAARGTNTFSSAMDKAKSVAKAFAAALGAIKVAQFAKEAAMTTARNEALGVILEQVGKNAGYTGQQAAYAEKMVKDMGITTSAARESLVRMAQAEIEWAHAADLARIAQDAAVIANTNSSEAFERMVYGIQTGYSRILKTMGLTVNFQKAYEDLASSLGTTTDALTEQQKVQARVNAVVEAGVGIQGSYEAAMGTVGKQLTSLPRYIEEAKASWGELFKPMLQLRVEMETRFWKAMKQIGDGLKGWGEVGTFAVEGINNVTLALEDMVKEIFKIDEKKTLWEELGTQVHNMAKGFMLLASWSAGFFGAFAAGFEALKAGPAALKEWASSFGEIRRQITDAALLQAIDSMPSLTKNYEELAEAVEKVDLSRGTEQIQSQITALKGQQAALEKRADILKQVEQIHVNYQRAVADEEKRYTEEIIKYNQQLAKKQLEIEQKHQKELRKLEEDAARKEAEIRADYARQTLEDERARNMELQHERARFQLDQLQSLRRFQQSEKWLRAEGDILGLMRLREDYEIQQQEAAENRDLQLRQDEQTYQEQRRLQEEEFQQRLEELKQETERRRQEVQESYLEELRDLQESNVEQRAEMQRAHEERLQDAIDARNRNLEDLGRSLQAEGEITKEGMTQIAAEIGKVFGDQGAADALINGWSARAESAIATTLANIAQRIQNLGQAISALESGEPITQYTGGGEDPTTGRRRRPRPRYGMRAGGSGVITGPAVFEVEPGVTEAFSFVPLSSQSTIHARVSGGINISGAEQASPGVVDAALERVVVSIEEAVKRLGDRRSNN